MIKTEKNIPYIDQHETSTGFDERETEVIESARFFEPYKEELQGLFTALNRGDQWSDDPRDMLPYMQKGWIGQEHGNAVEKDQFTDEEVAAAMPWLEKLGLTGEHLPELDKPFDQAIIVGGTTVANYRRSELVDKAIENGAQIGQLVYWLGQRPRETRDGKNEELMSTTGRFGGHDIADNPWVKNYVTKALEADASWALTETDFGRLALLKTMGGGLVPNRIHLPIVEVNGEDAGLPPRQPDTPPRDVLDYEFTTDRGLHVTLQNAAAVARRGGAPARPTTKSSASEWLERNAPAENARVLYVTGNPHSLRTTQELYKILNEQGRGDINLVVAGTSPVKGTPIQTYLGEVARLIHGDIKRNYSDAA